MKFVFNKTKLLFLCALQVIFFMMKILNLIQWNWWLVFAPFISPICLFMIMLVSSVLFAVLVGGFDGKKSS